MKRRFRLTRSTDFKRVRRSGRSYAHPLIVLIVARNSCNEMRIGVVAGVSIGKAVTRNYIKRRLRACLDELLPEIKLGWDVIVMARPPIIQASYPEIRLCLAGLFARAGLLDKVN